MYTLSLSQLSGECKSMCWRSTIRKVCCLVIKNLNLIRKMNTVYILCSFIEWNYNYTSIYRSGSVSWNTRTRKRLRALPSPASDITKAPHQVWAHVRQGASNETCLNANELGRAAIVWVRVDGYGCVCVCRVLVTALQITSATPILSFTPCLLSPSRSFASSVWVG